MPEENLTGTMWKTAKGEVMDIGNMDDSHLVNAANYLVIHFPSKVEIIAILQDEMALRGILVDYRTGKLDQWAVDEYKKKLGA